MKLNILICILLLAIVLTNASKSKAKSKAKSKSKSKKFLTVKTDNKSKDPEGNPVSVIPTTTNLNDDDSIVVVEQSSKQNFVATHQDVELEQPCKVKQGYMAMITSEKVRADGKHVMINAKSVFAVLNEKTLAVFENENVDALLTTIDIHDLAAPLVPEQWKEDKLNCFELHRLKRGAEQLEGENSEANNEQFVEHAVASFCLDSQDQMARWVKALKEFHKCFVQKQVTETEDSTANIGIRKVRREFKEEEEKEEEFQMVKQSRQDEEDRLEAEQDEQERKEIEAELAKIRHTYQLEKNQEKALERTQEERLEQIEEQTRLLEEKQKCIREALQTKAEAEVVASNQEERAEANRAQIAALEQVNSDVEGSGALERENEEKRAQEEEEAMKEQQDKIKNLMVEQTMEFEKDLNPMICVDPRLAQGDQQIEVIKEACGKTVEPGQPAQINELKRCLEKDNFCSYCCSYFIGMAHETKQQKCAKQCTGLINGGSGSPIQMHDNAYIIRVPVQHQAGVNNGSSNESAESAPAEPGRFLAKKKKH